MRGGTKMITKKGLVKGMIAFISITVGLASLFFLLKYRGCSIYEHYLLEQSRKNTVNVAQENKELLDSLAKRMYSQKIEIIVDYIDGQIQYKENVDGKKWESKSIDSDMENLLLMVFDSLNCESIVQIYRESDGKVLKIYIGDIITIWGGNLGSITLIYCENKSIYLYDEILPNWYYEPLLNV